MSDPKMVRKDFITSVVLIAFSLTVISMSYTMPRLERRGIDPFSAPGVVPGMIGVVLLCLALVLFTRSVRHGGYRIFGREGVSGNQRLMHGAAPRVLLTLFVSTAYAIGCLGRFGYFTCTALYIFTFICLFEFQSGKPFWGQKKMFLYSAIFAVVASLVITVVFQDLFLVDLP
jgi:putative tricarboxylic transport membrane protein